METTRLPIQFVRDLKPANWIDNFILELAKIDGDEKTLALDEVVSAFSKSDPLINIFTRHQMTAQVLFTDLKTYLTLRSVFRKECGGDQPPLPLAEPLWIEESLAMSSSLKSLRELISVVVYTHPEIKLIDIIGWKLFFITEKEFVERGLNLLKDSHTEKELDRLLGHHRELKAGHRKKIILTILEWRQKYPTRSIATAESLLDIIEHEKKQIIKSAIKNILKKKGQIMGALQLSFNTFYETFDGNFDPNHEFKHTPLGKKFEDHVVRHLTHFGIADLGIAKRMVAILKSSGFDPVTKAMIAYSLGAIHYDSPIDREETALLLYGYLNSSLVTTDKVDKEGSVHRHILEAIVSLGRLGFASVRGKDILERIARFAYDPKHPEAKVAAARAFGLIGISPKTLPEERKKILQTLSDLIGDPKSAVVAKAAYVWYQKVQETIR